MSTPLHFLAIDLGASSGRGIIGTLRGDHLAIREVHRFENGPVQASSGMHWDLPRLLGEIRTSIRAAASSLHPDMLSGIGIDTWGVDYALLDARGELLAPPFHYRDPRTIGLIEHVTARIPRAEIYARTGIQFMPFNTLYQLIAEQQQAPDRLARAARFLFIPDLLASHLTASVTTEASIASTSQLFDAFEKRWSWELIDALGLPRAIFPEILPPATQLGVLLPHIASATSAGPVPVFAPASHDTGSAVAAVPARGDDRWAYISSGTWSLLGRELRTPLCTPEALAANFTNEAGVESTIRFHKNIAGLWLLQECRRLWREQGHADSFENLVEQSRAAEPFRSLIDPDAPRFAEFGDMPARIRDFCASTNQPIPATIGQVVRCIHESLALKYRATLHTLTNLTGPIDRIHVVGGGVQNELLCQYTADAANLPVIAGPVEATAIGNILTQALARRSLPSLSTLRHIVAASEPTRVYQPANPAAWDAITPRFTSLCT